MSSKGSWSWNSYYTRNNQKGEKVAEQVKYSVEKLKERAETKRDEAQRVIETLTPKYAQIVAKLAEDLSGEAGNDIGNLVEELRDRIQEARLRGPDNTTRSEARREVQMYTKAIRRLDLIADDAIAVDVHDPVLHDLIHND